MVGLIILLILIPFVLIILLATILNRTGEQKRLLESLYDRLKQLSQEVADLTKELKDQKGVTLIKPVIKEKPEEKIVPVIPKATPAAEKEETVIEEKKPAVPEPVLAEPAWIESPIAEKEIPVSIPTPVKQERSKEKNTDIEKFIGENLANKIGIAVLVLGIAFFVKYAIDKNWIREAGRVIIGLVSGGILIGLAHMIRNSYRSFSSVLVGGGLSVFYFTIAFAFHEYHLIGQTPAFVIMVIISGLGVLLSLFYNRQELAILATIGGFITPFLVSTGRENYIALFTYLCILNTGLMVLSWFKRWPAINSIALFFTTIIYSGWLIKRTIFEEPATFPYKDAFLFATLFYLLFVAMNIINSIRLKNKFTAFDFIIVLSTNFLYYAAGMIVLSYREGYDYKGSFTLSLGIVNLLLAIIFYRKKSVDRNFVSLLIGLALTFISLAVAIQFRGDHIVLFWAAEAVILYWLYQRSKINLLKIASLVVMILMLGSLVLNWTQVYMYNEKLLPVIFNKGFVTTLAASVALFLYYWLLKKEKATDYLKEFSMRSARKMVLIVAVSAAYLAGVLEIFYQFSTRYSQGPVYIIYLQSYSFAFAILLLWMFRRDNHQPLMKFLFSGFCFVLYVISLSASYDVSMSLLTTGKKGLFLAHWIAAGLLLWLMYDLIVFFFKDNNKQWESYKSSFTWIATTGIVFVLSAEMYHVNLWINYRNDSDWLWWENLYYKAGLSILWGLCSFGMMWLGMKYRFRTLRIISLTLFSITLVKLFVFDIRKIPPGGKIAAFILLGILLLAVSFMYQRLKKIIIDNIAD